MARHYLVTGGAGFIGSHIAKHLLSRGEKVRVLDNFSNGKWSNLKDAPGAHVIEGDLRNRETVRESLDGITHVFHQAAVGSVPRSVRDPFETMTSNVDGTLNLLWEAKGNGVRRVVIAGSSSVYGDTPGMPRVETLPASPLSPYALSKLNQELLGKIATRLYGLETITLRYFNVFGPFQDPESEYAAVIPKFIQAIMAGQPITIFGTGLQSRDFTYVENVVEANIRAMDSEKGVGEFFNVGCGEKYSLLDLVEGLKRAMNREISIKFKKIRPGDPFESQADISKARTLLGFEPKIYFEEGLRRTVEWFTDAKNSPELSPEPKKFQSQSLSALPNESPTPSSLPRRIERRVVGNTFQQFKKDRRKYSSPIEG
ncbi:MAG: SDR family oxidoreductase [Leptospirales bacterium]